MCEGRSERGSEDEDVKTLGSSIAQKSRPLSVVDVLAILDRGRRFCKRLYNSWTGDVGVSNCI